MDTKINRIPPLSKTQIAHSYGVTTDTLYSWLKKYQEEMGEYKGKTYTPKQVSTIFGILGDPINLEFING